MKTMIALLMASAMIAIPWQAKAQMLTGNQLKGIGMLKVYEDICPGVDRNYVDLVASQFFQFITPETLTLAIKVARDDMIKNFKQAEAGSFDQAFKDTWCKGIGEELQKMPSYLTRLNRAKKTVRPA